MTEEQKDDTLILIERNTENLAGHPDGQVMQAIANVWPLLDYLSTTEPNAGVYQMRVTQKFCGQNSVQFTSQIENFLGHFKDGFKFIDEFKMKSMGMTEPKKMATFIALSGIASAL